MSSLSLNITSWAALAPGVYTADGWINYFQGEQPPVVPNGKGPAIAKIPPMLSRRLSLGSKFALQAALSVLATGDLPEAIVFASRHGELTRCEKLLNCLADRVELSPMEFSQSVHNTAAGVLSIISKLTCPSVSIAAGPDTFHACVREVCGFLQTGAKRVLAVAFDGQIPPKLGQRFPEAMPTMPYALAVMAESGDDFSFSAQTLKSSQEPSEGALAFLRAACGNASEFRTTGARHLFDWVRKDSAQAFTSLCALPEKL